MPKKSYEMCSASMSTHFGFGVMVVHNKVFGHVRKLLQLRFALRSRGGELVRHIYCVVSKNRGAGKDRGIAVQHVLSECCPEQCVTISYLMPYQADD